MTRLLLLDIRGEQGVVLARQRTRQIAELLGFDQQDQVRFATAVSEIARNAVQHGGGGRAEFVIDGRVLTVTIRDQGPGIADVQAVLDGLHDWDRCGRRAAWRMNSPSNRVPESTVVRLGKELPRSIPLPAGLASANCGRLTQFTPDNPLSEAQQQNRELLRLRWRSARPRKSVSGAKSRTRSNE